MITTLVDALHSRTTWTVSSVATLALASLAGLGVAYVMPGGAAAASGEVAPALTAAPAAPSWTIRNDLAGIACSANRGPRLSGSAHALELGEGCAAVSERLTEAVVWNEARDGAVTLSDATGRLVVAFAPADGPAMEAFKPRHMMLSLAREASAE